MSLKVVDLFCGTGGLSSGLQKAGLDVVAAYDKWPIAIETYNKNLSNHAHELDLTNVREAVKKIKQHNPDIIAGGPPCQDFSSAGHRIEKNNADLTKCYASIVADCKPSIVLMENVALARLSKTYKLARKILEKAGYHFFEEVLDASYCGVPQKRKRFFMVASLKNDLIDIKLRNWIELHKSENPLTIKEYLKTDIDIDYYYRHPRNYSRRSVFSVDEPSPTIRGVNRPVPPNYKRNHLDSCGPSKSACSHLTRKKPYTNLSEIMEMVRRKDRNRNVNRQCSSC